MNREGMGVRWTAGNAITPGRPSIVVVYKCDPFNRNMPTIFSGQDYRSASRQTYPFRCVTCPNTTPHPFHRN